MSRYFIELAYKGTNYAGFQKQDNANTIQAEIEKALSIYFRGEFNLTGSSRTDAGVHAKQNFFHFDTEILGDSPDFAKIIYHLNAILPLDIVVNTIALVNNDAHSRFDAKYRTYEYVVYQVKNPFIQDRAYYYPFKIDKLRLNELAAEILEQTNFESFSKKNTQVHTFNCTIFKSEWYYKEESLIYTVKANRFLRGMVKGLVGTMLRAALKNNTVEDFRAIINARDASKADFSVPSHGLTLLEVNYR